MAELSITAQSPAWAGARAAARCNVNLPQEKSLAVNGV